MDFLPFVESNLNNIVEGLPTFNVQKRGVGDVDVNHIFIFTRCSSEYNLQD